MIRHKIALALVLAALAAPCLPGRITAAPRRHALLVGVTSYPHLDSSLWLDGGANDVLLTEQLLRGKFSFARENIVILSEAEGGKDSTKTPTRAHIERECRRLAKVAHEDDRVVVFLSGHGSLQPEKLGLPDPSPDGLERIFLPRDVKSWTRTAGAVNAITGRDLAEWLRPIALKKALLWVVVDTCHSGEMLRGVNERVRQVDPERGLRIPRQALQEAMRRARHSALRRRGPAAFVPRLAHLDGVALLYACQGHEVTVERNFPPEADNARPYGLLTYTLNRILRTASAPLTYRELTLRIQNEYVAMDRTFPTPVIEGRGRDRTVLESKKLDRLPIVLTKREDGLTINAGQLHGLSAGSILAVHPPPGQKGSCRGYIRIHRIEPTTALVTPCAFAGRPVAAEAALAGGRCELVQLHFGELKLRVGVDRFGSRASENTEKGRQQLGRDLDALARTLAALGKAASSPVEHVAEQSKAEWLVRFVGGKAYLLRAAEWEAGQGIAGTPARGMTLARVLGPFEAGDKLPDRLRDCFTRIVRARNLLKLAARPAGEIASGRPSSQPRGKVQVRHTSGKPGSASQAIPTFYDGDTVEMRLTNTGRVAIDVTLLYVDSQYGIEALFPIAEHNRLRPGSSVRVPPVDVKTRTTGREYVVLIAVRAKELEPVDFVSLAQPSIHEALGADHSRGGSRGLASPLGRLFQKALYGAGTTRAMSSRDAEDYFLQLLPVQVEARR